MAFYTLYTNPRWTYGTDVLDPYSSYATRAVYNIAAPCTSGRVASLVPWIDEHLVNRAYNPTKDLYVPTLDPVLKTQTKGTLYASYFGSCHSPNAPPRPQPKVLEMREDQKGTMKRKEFMEKKAKGVVVVQPRHVDSIRIRSEVGIPTDALILKAVNQSAKRFIPFPSYGARRTACVSASTTLYVVDHLPNTVFNGPGIETDPKAVYDRYDWSGVWGEHPSGADLYDLGFSFREQLLARPPQIGLVTSATADANNRYWDILTELAELPELVKYILNCLKEAADIISIFKAKRKALLSRGAAKEIASQLADWWLEFRYAIMPLVYSIEDAFAYFSAAETIFQTTRARDDSKVSVPDLPGYVTEDTVDVIERCFIKRSFTSASAGVFLTKNLLVTAWEKVTLSFVVDWFLNIGDLLTSLLDPPGIKSEGSTFSSQVKPTTVTYVRASDSSRVTVTFQGYKTSPITPSAHTGLVFSPHITWKRTLDAVALSWGALRRRF